MELRSFVRISRGFRAIPVTISALSVEQNKPKDQYESGLGKLFHAMVLCLQY